MIHYKAKPVSRAMLSNMARKFRDLMGMDDIKYIPIIELVEFILPRIDSKFDIEVVEKNELPEGTYALTYPDESRMLIREDVYNETCSGNARARFTIAHELCHYLMHESSNISFARSTSEVPVYMDPEWQANVFAAELLIPKHLIQGLTIDEVVESCGVSYQCARIQMKHYDLL